LVIAGAGTGKTKAMIVKMPFPSHRIKGNETQDDQGKKLMQKWQARLTSSPCDAVKVEELITL